jgi:hypothetical protein
VHQQSQLPQQQGGDQGQNNPSTAQTALQVMQNVNDGLKLMNDITGALTGGNNNDNSGGTLIIDFDTFE